MVSWTVSSALPALQDRTTSSSLAQSRAPDRLNLAITMARATHGSESTAARHRIATIEGANLGAGTLCEQRTHPENLTRCPRCGSHFCERCIMFCTGCEHIQCRACPCLCNDVEVAANATTMERAQLNKLNRNNRAEGSAPDVFDAEDAELNQHRVLARERMRGLDERAARALSRAGPYHRQQPEHRNRDVGIRVVRVQPTAEGLGFGPDLRNLDVPEHMYTRRLHQVVAAEVGQSIALLSRDRACGLEFIQNDPHSAVSMSRRRTIYYCLDEDLSAIAAVMVFDGEA